MHFNFISHHVPPSKTLGNTTLVTWFLCAIFFTSWGDRDPRIVWKVYKDKSTKLFWRWMCIYVGVWMAVESRQYIIELRLLFFIKCKFSKILLVKWNDFKHNISFTGWRVSPWLLKATWTEFKKRKSGMDIFYFQLTIWCLCVYNLFDPNITQNSSFAQVPEEKT